MTIVYRRMRIMSSSSYNAVTPIHCAVHLKETDISLKGTLTWLMMILFRLRILLQTLLKSNKNTRQFWVAHGI